MNQPLKNRWLKPYMPVRLDFFADISLRKAYFEKDLKEVRSYEFHPLQSPLQMVCSFIFLKFKVIPKVFRGQDDTFHENFISTNRLKFT